MKDLITKATITGVVVAIFITFFILFSKQEVDKNHLTPAKVSATIDAISILLSEKSPYFDINKYRVDSKIDSVIRALDSNDKVNDTEELLNNVEHILSELGDRHVSVKKLGPEQKEERYYLPFALAPWQENEVIALRQHPKLKYSFYLESYPFLSSIQNENINKFMHRLDILNKYAPSQSRLSLGVEKLNEFYQINRHLKIGHSVRLKFSNRNRTKDTLVYVNLVSDKTKWREINKNLFRVENTKKPYRNLRRSYGDGIEYLRIPEMFYKYDNELFFQWLTEYMNSIKDSNALIIDIRNNPGGNRDIINFFSNYFIKSEDYFVTNFARYKGELTNDIKESLNKRNLYPISHFNDITQDLILQEMSKNLKDNEEFNGQNYSDYYYMVLKNNEHLGNYYYYNKPVYLMINESTFSAASVFASSFKGLDKVTLVGVKSDGSSGLSQSYELSGLRIKFSHMLSFQKNGDLFDGVGIDPDIEIKRSIDQIFGLEDHQLDVLLTKIKTN